MINQVGVAVIWIAAIVGIGQAFIFHIKFRRLLHKQSATSDLIKGLYDAAHRHMEASTKSWTATNGFITHVRHCEVCTKSRGLCPAGQTLYFDWGEAMREIAASIDSSVTSVGSSIAVTEGGPDAQRG